MKLVDSEKASASAVLNRMTKPRTAKARSRDRKSRKLATAAWNVRVSQLSCPASGGFPARGRFRVFRLARQQRRRDTDQDEDRHHAVTRAPGCAPTEDTTQPCHQQQRAGAGRQRADPVGGNVGCKTRCLLVFLKAFDAKGINYDVLRRGRRCDEQGAECDDRGRNRRVGQPEQHDRDHQPKLREQQPAAAPAQQRREHRDVESIGKRRPEEFDAVGNADGREQTDGPHVEPALRHPRLQRRADQHDGEAARKAEQQHNQHAPFEIHRKRFAQRLVLQSPGGVGCAHAHGLADLVRPANAGVIRRLRASSPPVRE